MDSFNTHTVGSLYEAFDAAKARELASRLEIRYTPKCGSWLNFAEFALSRQCLSRRIANTETLNRELGYWQDAVKAYQRPVNWHFTTNDARIMFRHLYPEH